MGKNAEQAFFQKNDKKLFYPKFQSVHVNWHISAMIIATRFQNKQQMIT